ncbi:mitotic checkpoint protein-domain-containing protein [Chiua virens]|nr:mitotic checkpoint protein-domain-containing protein [Chiua virens]
MSASGPSSSRPSSRTFLTAGSLPSARTKRDSLMAELEHPQHAPAKRQQRSQAFSSYMAHAAFERQLLAAQAAKTELEHKLRQKDVYIEQLESDRRFLAEREKAELDEKKQEREASIADKAAAEADLRALREAMAGLRNEHVELEEEYAVLRRTHGQVELVAYRANAEEREATISVLQQKLDEAEVASEPVVSRRNEDENWGVIRDELHRQASYLRSLETTNAKLNAELGRYKDRHANLEVLREEKRALERKVLVVDELRGKVVSLEAQVEAAGENDRIGAPANRSNEVSTPSKPSLSVVQSLSELRLTHARLLEEHGVNGEVQSLKDKVTRREQRAQLAEREVGILASPCGAYEYLHAMPCLTVFQASFTAEDQATRETATPDSGLSQRVQQLEQTLSEYKATNCQLQKALDAIDSEDCTDGLSKKLEAQPRLHEDKVEELEQTLFELRGKIGAGNHVPPGMRVLCLHDNPAQQWSDLRQSVMDRLKGENEALIKRLRDLEQSGVQAETSRGEELVPRESWEVLRKEKEELEEVVKQKEKRLLRLQQVFTAKSAEFREAIASILGLKLAFYPNGQVRVTSVYDLSASFVFQPLSKTSAEWGWCTDAAGCAGRGRSPGSAAADALLG